MGESYLFLCWVAGFEADFLLYSTAVHWNSLTPVCPLPLYLTLARNLALSLDPNFIVRQIRGRVVGDYIGGGGVDDRNIYITYTFRPSLACVISPSTAAEQPPPPASSLSKITSTPSTVIPCPRPAPHGIQRAAGPRSASATDLVTNHNTPGIRAAGVGTVRRRRRRIYYMLCPSPTCRDRTGPDRMGGPANTHTHTKERDPVSATAIPRAASGSGSGLPRSRRERERQREGGKKEGKILVGCRELLDSLSVRASCVSGMIRVSEEWADRPRGGGRGHALTTYLHLRPGLGRCIYIRCEFATSRKVSIYLPTYLPYLSMMGVRSVFPEVCVCRYVCAAG